MPLGTKHTWPRTQNSPCPGGKKICFPLNMSVHCQQHSLSSSCISKANHEHCYVLGEETLAADLESSAWEDKVPSPSNSMVLTPKSDFASHKQSDPTTWGAKIPYRIPDYTLAKVARSYTLQVHLLILRVLTTSNSVVADQVITGKFCTNKGIKSHKFCINQCSF